MCKYLFSSGQVPKKSFLEPSFIQYIDSVAYLHCQHIPIYIQKICKSWNKYIKIHETIYTSSPPEGFLIIQSLHLFIVTHLPTLPPQYKAQRVYIFFLLAQTFKYRIKLRKLYIFFIWHTSVLAKCAMYKLWLQRKLTVEFRTKEQ